MKKSRLATLVLLGAILVAVQAKATSLNWTSDTCVTVDHTFHVCKPSEKWDTVKTGNSDLRPVEWVYHKNGPNPRITLRYNPAATGKTAHDYAKVVSSNLKADGLKVDSIKNENIAGRNVSVIRGTNTANGFRYLVGVWRNKSKGFELHCSAQSGDFPSYEPACRASIQSVRIVNEH